MGETRWLRVPVAEIAFVRAIYEAYDNLCILTAPAAERGELCLWIAPGHEDIADEIERKLSRDAGLQRIAAPTDGGAT
jgi:hypothetical protein